MLELRIPGCARQRRGEQRETRGRHVQIVSARSDGRDLGRPELRSFNRSSGASVSSELRTRQEGASSEELEPEPEPGQFDRRDARPTQIDLHEPRGVHRCGPQQPLAKPSLPNLGKEVLLEESTKQASERSEPAHFKPNVALPNVRNAPPRLRARAFAPSKSTCILSVNGPLPKLTTTRTLIHMTKTAPKTSLSRIKHGKSRRAATQKCRNQRINAARA
jgi:hypothetical protein